MVGNRTRRDVRQVIRIVLAASYACDERVLIDEGIAVVEASERAGRLRFPLWSKPLQAVTMGAGVVVGAHPDRLEWLHANLGHLQRDEIFSAPVIGELARYVERDGQQLAGPNLKYACSADDFRPAAIPAGAEIALVESDDVATLYQYPGFGTALSYRLDTPRPDVLATVATRSGTVVGVAAASADADDLWQIGVEVTSAARGEGIGCAVVSHLTQGILDRGKIPYYSTTVSNIPSRALAINLGYWPAWTELYARDR